MSKVIDRVRGALYGVAVGDALGAPLEFMDAESIQRQHGTVRDMIGGGWLNVEPGEVTDDTQMTLCVAHGIVSAPYDPVVSVGVNFLRWADSRPKDIGATCASAISRARYIAAKEYWSTSRIWRNDLIPAEDNWRAAALYTHDASGGRSAGNGSLMRTVYAGLYYDKATDACIKAAHISEMTHHDELATEACIAYSVAVFSILFDMSDVERRIVMRDVIETASDHRYDFSLLSSDSFTPNPSGYVVDSFSAALHCICTTSSFEEALVKAVNLGGDADTIGAITGGLAGALYGYKAIPGRWTKRLSSELCADMEWLTAEAMKNKPE